MTLTTLTNRIAYSGDSISVAFAFPYYFLANADLVVVTLDSSNVETTLVLNTDYTVDGAADVDGGTVTLISAPASGTRLTIYRSPALQQDLDLENNGSMPAEEVEKRLDKAMMIQQRESELLSRTMTLSESDAAADMTLPLLADRLNKYLGFDASGLPVAASSFTPGVTASAYIQTLLVAATAAAARTLLGFDVSGNLPASLVPASLITNAMLTGSITAAKMVDAFNSSGVSAVKTSTYAVLSSDATVQLDPATPFTATLPTAVGASGKVYELLHAGTQLCQCTIATTSAQTIKDKGVTATTNHIDSPGECLVVKSDGANWVVIRRYIPSKIVAYTPDSGTNQGFGTITSSNWSWNRVGNLMRIRGTATTGTAAGSEARIALPQNSSSSGLVATMAATGVVGSWYVATNAAVNGTIIAQDTTAFICFGIQGGSNSGLTKANGSTIIGNTTAFAVDCWVPIASWNG